MNSFIRGRRTVLALTKRLFLFQVLLFICALLLTALAEEISPSTVPALSTTTPNSSSQPITHTHRPKRRRKVVWLVDEDEEDDEEEAENVLSRPRRKSERYSYDGNTEGYRASRRKEVPVNYRLLDDLLRNYNKGARPVKHPSEIVNVSMSAFLYQIFKLDAVKNTISLSGSFELYWHDSWLQWNPANYEGATEVFLPSSDIWLPELSLYYSVNFNSAVKLLSNNDARVNYTGHVRWYLPFSTESLCSSVDVKFFPFDIQQCTLMFGSWAHSNDSIKYALYSQNLSLIDFYDNQEWQLDMSRSHITAQAFLYDYLDPPLFWEMIIVELVVGRQSFYYVFNLVIPSGIIAVVAVVGFHTPSTSARVRDAKFRLGIMTLMSMSTIVVAIVEDMPKFSMSGSRKARGSFSGVPLIGLYYFMLLVIVGLSTMTTSMFVFLERDFRTKRRIPWYLRWLSYDIRRRTFNRAYNYGDTTVEPSTTEALLSSQSSTGPHRHLNGFVGEGNGPRTRGSQQQQAQGMAMSLLRLVPNENDHEHGRQVQAVIDETSEGYQHTIFNPGAQDEPSPPLRRQLRKRLSLAHYDNMLLYQYFGQQIEDLSGLIQRIERSVKDIKGDMVALLPQNDLNSKWQTVIRRLELLSLSFYMSLLFTTAFLFFYHDWYCAIGNSPCGTPNHKCPWMKVEPCG